MQKVEVGLHWLSRCKMVLQCSQYPESTSELQEMRAISEMNTSVVGMGGLFPSRFSNARRSFLGIEDTCATRQFHVNCCC